MFLAEESGSKPVDCSNSRLCWHPLRWDDHDLAALVQNQLPEIVEQVVDFRMGQIAKLDATRRVVDPAGDVAFGFDPVASRPTRQRPPRRWAPVHRSRDPWTSPCRIPRPDRRAGQDIAAQQPARRGRGAHRATARPGESLFPRSSGMGFGSPGGTDCGIPARPPKSGADRTVASDALRSPAA